MVVFDGDPVVGRALELLLRTAGYDARYVDHTFMQQPGALDGVRVVLLGPGWSVGSREVVVKSARGAAGIPVLEVGPPTDGVAGIPERLVPWPCRTEDLKRRIDAQMAEFVAENGGGDGGMSDPEQRR